MNAQDIRDRAGHEQTIEEGQVPNGKVLRRWAVSVAALALLIWWVIIWVHFGRVIIRFYSPLPYRDYWNTVAQINNYRHLDIGVLWQQHNEHRIVFPVIIFA